MTAIIDDPFNYMGPTATPMVISNITIEASGARLEHAPNGVLFRAFAVADTGSLTIRNVHVKGFAVKGGDGDSGGGGGMGAGGAIYVHGGSLTIENSTFENNGAAGGNGGRRVYLPGGGGGGLGGNGGYAQGNDAHQSGGDIIGELSSGGGGGGGGSRGNGGANGGTSPLLVGWASEDGGGGGGTRDPGGDGYIPNSVSVGGPGGFRCGGDGGEFDEDGDDASCAGGGGGGGGTPLAVTGFLNGDGGDGGYGGGGGGGAHHHSVQSGSSFSSSGGTGGFGGGGGAASEGDMGGTSVFGGGGGAGDSAGQGGTFGGDGDDDDGGAGAALGGAIFGHKATITIRNSTFTGNSVAHGVSPAALGPAQDAGGAIFLVAGSLTVLNSTISGNQSTGDGAGIVVYKPTTGEATSFNLRNTIIAGNDVRECFYLGGPVVFGSGNLIVQNFGCPGMEQTGDPLLGPLQLNAPGLTPTMEIPPNSPAVDSADAVTALSTDQRGVLRPQYAGFDIGAYEAAPPDSEPPVITVSVDPVDLVGGNGWYNIQSSGTDGVLVHVSATDATAVTSLACADGSTNVLNVAVASGSFTLGGGQHSISCDASDGINAAGSATGSTAMPVVVYVDQTAPTLNPVVSPNPVEIGGSATVVANAADAMSGLASSSCGVLDLQTAGVKSVTCQAADVAGNTNSASAEYTVAYRFLGFLQPIPQSAYKRGSTIPVRFMLGQAGGAHLADAAAQALISPTCLVRITLDGTVQPGCATYDASRDTFQYDLKTAKSISAGNHTLGIQVSASDSSGVINGDSTTIVIKR
jgi:hypothetical protein